MMSVLATLFCGRVLVTALDIGDDVSKFTHFIGEFVEFVSDGFDSPIAEKARREGYYHTECLVWKTVRSCGCVRKFKEYEQSHTEEAARFGDCRDGWKSNSDGQGSQDIVVAVAAVDKMQHSNTSFKNSPIECVDSETPSPTCNNVAKTRPPNSVATLFITPNVRRAQAINVTLPSNPTIAIQRRTSNLHRKTDMISSFTYHLLIILKIYFDDRCRSRNEALRNELRELSNRVRELEDIVTDIQQRSRDSADTTERFADLDAPSSSLSRLREIEVNKTRPSEEEL
ncbi:hypothetical protein QR680_010349 [Steinernema hermaphroditum]|uniref:Uncharacterized protein n=1 Tax=Steinernema hermaphroditum TaxID=289476 RepID=A0AA39INP1_9BILA|nr:hypothetical protein QR680_010349 [Steinernema hermaphroditum]